MLTCKEVSQRASSLLDGELSLWDRLQMRLHLAFCHGCSHFVDQLRITRDLSMVAPEPKALDASDRQNIEDLLSKMNGVEK